MIGSESITSKSNGYERYEADNDLKGNKLAKDARLSAEGGQRRPEQQADSLPQAGLGHRGGVVVPNPCRASSLKPGGEAMSKFGSKRLILHNITCIRI